MILITLNQIIAMLRKSFLFTVFIVLLVLTGCTKKESTIQTLFGTQLSKDQIDTFLEYQMQTLEMPALSIAIINEGEVVYHSVKGYADKEKKLLADDRSIFEGASISKSVFGYFVMTFVEDGMLDLDKPLYEYLPNPDIAHDERYKKITARIVLSHRSGFPNWRDDYPEKKLFIQFEPGSAYHYSGEGYQYLAEVLKALLHTNWAGLEAEFQKRVAIPFNMQHTKFIKDDYIRKHKVQPYDKDGKWIDKSKEEWWIIRDSVFVAPTTIHSEAIDFSKWMIAMMDKKGLSEKGFETLYQPHSEIANSFIREEYTIGFVKLSILNLGELFSHSGNNTGFSSYFALDKDKKWGFVFFTNSKAGDQLALNLSYKLLLAGSIKKQIAIGLALVCSLILLITNLVLRLVQKSTIDSIRNRNLFSGFVVTVGILACLLLMLTVYQVMATYIYILILLIVMIFSSKTLRIIRASWKALQTNKMELIFQTILLCCLILSGIVIGILQ
ncbi:MAG: serine hydrolase domain-containing protein [bacterium]